MNEFSEKQFNRNYIMRVRAARLDSGLSQADMAKALGISKDRYQKYEQRSPLPLHLVERFALICRVDPWFLITGRQVERRIPKANMSDI